MFTLRSKLRNRYETGFLRLMKEDVDACRTAEQQNSRRADADGWQMDRMAQWQMEDKAGAAANLRV